MPPRPLAVALVLASAALSGAAEWISAGPGQTQVQPKAAAPRALAQTAPVTAHAPGKTHLELDDTNSATCIVCHEDIPKGAVVHGPVGGGECTACHAFSGQGDQMKVSLVAGATGDHASPLCLGCHEDIAEAITVKYVHGPAGSGDCLSCHEAHTSSNRRLLKERGPDACTGCHSEVGQDLARKTKHVPVAADCALCHDPHGSPHPAQLRESTNDLCLACHIWPRSSGSAPVTQLFARELEASTMGMVAPELVVELDRSRRFGHPILRHPVAGPKDPLDDTKPFTCLSCHSAHGADGPSLLRFAAEDPMEACVKCHK